ncbi:MAG: periplasmic heavy metal sensor [Armatimonadota bacterium]|nr:periplasmic heavy metal sensor [Armatimonadota bacterium]MDR7439832.1 periplasmic heavy metal sensor [Armatimonadota bacterium]MDR7563917.1 periplasmic heavy metal sensor [Armatimonadota bacterium]MDR7567552.1 periplasmic heavy metal sensor [Armatimonadota bacterium]MDR7601638.1 periplasmic heavy metal sensor [Armatimonadota bacterium]
MRRIGVLLLLLALLAGAWAWRPARAATAPVGRFVCRDPAVRSQIETVYDRHRISLRNARLRVEDERYALRRLLLSPQATRQQVESQAARLAEAQTALQRARLSFLLDLREGVPADRREQVLRCVLGPWRGFRW